MQDRTGDLERVGFLKAVETERGEAQRAEKPRTKGKGAARVSALGRRPSEASKGAGARPPWVEQIKMKAFTVGPAVDERSEGPMLQEVGQGQLMCL